MDLTISLIEPCDLDLAALAIAQGEVFQWYGLDLPRARRVIETVTGETVVARVSGQVVGVAIYRNDGSVPLAAYLRILAVGEMQRRRDKARCDQHGSDCRTLVKRRCIHADVISHQ